MKMFQSPIRPVLIKGEDKDYKKITDDIVRAVLGKPTIWWYLGVFVSGALFLWGVYAILRTVYFGIGEWGIHRTVGWGWAIINFVWWIGIGHAGTLISAILLLFRQQWRTAVNRSAEAMTIFAVMCAGMFPLIHVGRHLVVFFIFPYPNSRGPLWVNFNSPLFWDVTAISTYFLVSLLFWYIGLIPDLAIIRDRAKNPLVRKIYGILSFGWLGSVKQWQRWESISLHLAGLATPLVLSVHSIVSFDFATSVIPGWHTTIFPPYFVAGAIFSGFAMVLTLLVIARKAMGLEDYITIDHIESMNKIMLATGSIVGIAYMTELFIAWYSGNLYERYVFLNRMLGPYWWAYWTMIACNVLIPQLLWIKKIRRNPLITFIISIFVNIGMWFERFVIVVTSLHRDYLPSAWSFYKATWVEVSIYLGTLGFFFLMFLLFARFFPVIAVSEIKHILKLAGEKAHKEFKREAQTSAPAEVTTS